MKKQKRSFDETRRLAKHLGQRIKLIEEKMPFSGDLHRRGATLLTISDSMSLIADTPNASFNDTALEAFNREVDQAIEAIKEWGRKLLRPDGEDNDEWDDEIPF